MAIRDDFTIDWGAHPRIITIAKPSTECSMQDLLDTLRFMEAEPVAMDNKSIVDSSGKEVLDTTNKVGLTVTLQDATVGFEARDGTEFGGTNEWTQCFFDGGNLVAVDTYFNPPKPIISTANNAFVNLTTTKSSSATLQEQDALQYSSYGERVSVDLVKGLTGISYPSGNMEYRVNNFIDAVDIAWLKGFNVIELRDDNSIDTDVNISRLKIRGLSHLTTTLFVGYDAIANTCIFDNLHITGFLDGDSEVNNCIFEDLLYFNGHIHGGGWTGKLILAGNKPAKIDNVSMATFDKPAILDCGGGGQDAIINGFEGMVTVENLTNPATIGFGFKNGIITLDETCTAGVIILSGNYKLTDNSGVGCTVISNGKLLTQNDIPTVVSEVWDHVDRTLTVSAVTSPQEIWEYHTRILTSAGAGGATAQEVWEYLNRTLTSGSGGLDEGELHTALDNYVNKDDWKADVTRIIDYNEGSWKIIANQMIYYRVDGSELMRFDLLDSAGQPISRGAMQRVKA